jgi:omega-amidase
MRELRTTLLQTTLLWEDPVGNRMIIEEQLKPIRKGSTDVIVLPEMFNSGFTMNAQRVAETMSGPTICWMQDLARRKNAAVCGSLVIRANKRFFNRFVWVQPDGVKRSYDKRHLFRMASENKTYTAGTKRTIINYNGWRISPQVCYDLRFPVWSRNDRKYDLLIYVANWPDKRRAAWNTLLPARAIENQAFVVAVNRVGKDAKGMVYAGDSVVYDPWGEKLGSTPEYKGSLSTIKLNKKVLENARTTFPVSEDADRFSL